MINVITLETSDGLGFPIFLVDDDTGYSGRDVLKTPGVYEELTGGKFGLVLADMTGTINGYATSGMFLILDAGEAADLKVVDITSTFKQYVTVPEAAVKMLLQREDPDMRGVIENGIATLRVYEGLTTDNKVFLPKSSLRFFEEEVQKKMTSKRQVYVIKSVDNQEIVQTDCTAEYGIVLPDVEDIHTSESVTSALDILRVCAPCRQERVAGVFEYQGIYHTPYWKIDPKFKTLPEHLKNISGSTRNDTLELQPNERHMYNNLYTLVCADTARYVAELVTGVFLGTRYGQKLVKCANLRSSDILLEMVGTLSEGCPEGVSCSVSYSDVQTLTAGKWDVSDTAKLLKSSLTVSEETLEKLVKDVQDSSRVVDTDRLPFVLDLNDEACERFTGMLLEQGIVSRAVMEYLISLCQRAYEVNWGFTGATKAIPHFVTYSTINVMNKAMAAHLSSTLRNMSVPPDVNLRDLYSSQYIADDDDDMGDDNGDEIFSAFDYYITIDTQNKVLNGSLEPGYFAGGESNEFMTSEAEQVEYWRKVNGEQRLYYFLSTSFINTGDVKLLIDAFIKLMRWGSVKPAMLVFEKYPSIKTVFDLNLGMEVKNTAIVDESQLVLVQGCRYTMAGFVSARDVLIVGEESIVGFLLCKNYGEVQRYFVASFVDIGEMVVSGEIDVAELKSVTQFTPAEMTHSADALSNARFGFYVSQRNSKRCHEFNMPQEEVNELRLLMTVPDVLRSTEYIKSLANKMVIGKRDRQYAILSTYVKTMRQLYEEQGAILSADVLTSVEVNQVSKRAYDLFLSLEQGQAPDANKVRATNAVQSMNLDLGSSTKPAIKFVDIPLQGKFTVISDPDLKSVFPAISFTDPSVRNVANKVKNRIVLLLLELEETLVFCQKDIAASEVKIVGHQVDHKRYSAVAPIIDRLMQGRKAMVNMPNDGGKKEAVLHESLRQFL